MIQMQQDNFNYDKENSPMDNQNLLYYRAQFDQHLGPNKITIGRHGNGSKHVNLEELSNQHKLLYDASFNSEYIEDLNSQQPHVIQQYHQFQQHQQHQPQIQPVFDDNYSYSNDVNGVHDSGYNILTTPESKNNIFSKYPEPNCNEITDDAETIASRKVLRRVEISKLTRQLQSKLRLTMATMSFRDKGEIKEKGILGSPHAIISHSSSPSNLNVNQGHVKTSPPNNDLSQHMIKNSIHKDMLAPASNESPKRLVFQKYRSNRISPNRNAYPLVKSYNAKQHHLSSSNLNEDLNSHNQLQPSQSFQHIVNNSPNRFRVDTNLTDEEKDFDTSLISNGSTNDSNMHMSPLHFHHPFMPKSSGTDIKTSTPIRHKSLIPGTTSGDLTSRKRARTLSGRLTISDDGDGSAKIIINDNINEYPEQDETSYRQSQNGLYRRQASISYKTTSSTVHDFRTLNDPFNSHPTVVNAKHSLHGDPSILFETPQKQVRRYGSISSNYSQQGLSSITGSSISSSNSQHLITPYSTTSNDFKISRSPIRFNELKFPNINKKLVTSPVPQASNSLASVSNFPVLPRNLNETENIKLIENRTRQVSRSQPRGRAQFPTKFDKYGNGTFDVNPPRTPSPPKVRNARSSESKTPTQLQGNEGPSITDVFQTPKNSLLKGNNGDEGVDLLMYLAASPTVVQPIPDIRTPGLNPLLPNNKLNDSNIGVEEGSNSHSRSYSNSFRTPPQMKAFSSIFSNTINIPNNNNYNQNNNNNIFSNNIFSSPSSLKTPNTKFTNGGLTPSTPQAFHLCDYLHGFTPSPKSILSQNGNRSTPLNGVNLNLGNFIIQNSSPWGAARFNR